MTVMFTTVLNLLSSQAHKKCLLNGRKEEGREGGKEGGKLTSLLGGGGQTLTMAGKMWKSYETFCTYLAQRTQCVCRHKEYKKRWRYMFHTLMDLSSEAVARYWPSAEKSTLRTGAV